MTERADVVVIGLGALGSAAAHRIAARGLRVVGLERFELRHARGASHDSSRIVRRSYHTPAYVRLAAEAYDDWAALSAVAGEQLVTVTGGLDLFPPGAAIPLDDYADAMSACGVPYDVLSPAEVAVRWPRVGLPAGGRALFQADTGIVHAARTVALLQRLAAAHGADLRASTPATAVADGPTGVEVETPAGRIRCDRLVVTADAWTNEVLAGLGVTLPLTVTQEQVTYVRPDRPADFAPGRFPVWIWMDDPSFYGFPTYGEPTVKAGQDVGGRVTTADSRDFAPSAENLARLTAFLSATFPGSVRAVDRTVTCLYTLTPDRDFVLGPLPGHPDVVVGLGAGHGFKFAPTFGRVLAELALDGRTGSDIGPFAADRPALTEAGHPVSWLV